MVRPVSESILDKRLILVVGKGGVGRSTVAASIAAACARRGRKTLLFQANANDRFANFFGAGAVGTAISKLRDNLYAVNTNPGAALEEYGLMVLRFKRVYKMVFENRVTRYFLRAIPGLDDYAVLGKAWYHTTSEKQGRPEWDTLVFDMPASGHSLSMLRIPFVILDTVPEGPLTRDARSLRDLLLDRRRTATVLVTLAEEMPTNEAVELSAALRENTGIEISRLIVNQVYPDRFPAESPQRAVLDALSKTDEPMLRSAALHAGLTARRRELNEHYLAELAAAVSAPMGQLPLLFKPSLGPTEIDALSKTLEDDIGI
jgi:anion-transporting  ArsA/GET3 family ATPase